MGFLPADDRAEPQHYPLGHDEAIGQVQVLAHAVRVDAEPGQDQFQAAENIAGFDAGPLDRLSHHQRIGAVPFVLGLHRLQAKTGTHDRLDGRPFGTQRRESPGGSSEHPDERPGLNRAQAFGVADELIDPDRDLDLAGLRNILGCRAPVDPAARLVSAHAAELPDERRQPVRCAPYRFVNADLVEAFDPGERLYDLGDTASG